jgi:hypothetical protein
MPQLIWSAASLQNPAYRSWPIAFGTGGYLALYRIDRQNQVILAVRHFREQSFRTD